jgi:hypothetical protein
MEENMPEDSHWASGGRKSHPALGDQSQEEGREEVNSDCQLPHCSFFRRRKRRIVSRDTGESEGVSDIWGYLDSIENRLILHGDVQHPT